MTLRIKEDDRGEFARVFSNCNQFKPLELNGSAVPKNLERASSLYLLGLRYKSSAFGDELEVYATKPQDPSNGFQVAAIRAPRAMAVTEEESGKKLKLSVTGSDGKELVLVLRGDLSQEIRKEVTAKIAYALFERNGRVEGMDFEHWGEAEKVSRDLSQLVNNRFV